MRKKAPVVMAGIALLAVLFALLRSLEGEPTTLPPTIALPDTGCRLFGRVLDSAGAPLPGAGVQAVILTPGTAHASVPATTGNDGTFEVRLFPARGHWSVNVTPFDRPGFTDPTPIPAKPGGRIRIEIREPATPLPEAKPPNIGGEVHLGDGRLLTGIPIIVTTADGKEVLRGVSGNRGEFALHVERDPPFSAHVEAVGKQTIEITRLPRLDLEFILPTPDPGRGEMTIDFIPRESIEDREARIRLYDSLGQERLEAFRGVREGPHSFRHILYGAYDIRVDSGGHAGALQGFDFRPDQSLAEIPLAAAATLKGRFDAPAEALLFSRSPTYAPVSRSFREDDGVAELYRGLWEKSKPGKQFEFGTLPAGSYLLRILARGFESVDQSVDLVAGQTLDLGRIELTPATGRIEIVIKDRIDRPDDLEFGYLIHLYEVNGHCRKRHLGPGARGSAGFSGLPAGDYQYRVERKLKGELHTRSVGWDQAVPLGKGESRTLEVDCTWRFE